MLQYSVTKMRTCCAQFHSTKFNVPGTNFSIKQQRGKNALLQNRTRSTLSYSIFATTEPGVVCLRHLQGVHRQENACPPSPLMLFILLRSDHLKRTIIKEQRRQAHTDKKHEAQATSLPWPNALPRKRKIILQPRSKAVPSLLFRRVRTAYFLR